MEPLDSVSLPKVKGNPWPRRWQPKDQDIYLNDSYFKRKGKLLSKIVITSNDDFLPLRKYYSKNLDYMCIINLGVPRDLHKRCKFIKELKVFSHNPIKSTFMGIRKLTLDIHAKNIQTNPELVRIVKRNKHICSLKVSNFENFKAFFSCIKTLNNLKTFYLDSKNVQLTDIMKNLSPFLCSNIKLQKLGLLLKDNWLEGEENPNNFLYDSKFDSYQQLFHNIFNKNDLKTLKLDISCDHLLENQGRIAKNLLERIAKTNLERFDVRLCTTDLINMSQEVRDLVSNLDYLAITTEGDLIQSIFGDAEERLRLQKSCNKLLMLNFEGSKTVDILNCLQYSFKNLVTLDLNFKGDSFIFNEPKNFQLSCNSTKNILLYFELCSSKIVKILESLSWKNFPAIDHLGFALKNLIYDDSTYKSIHNFLKPLNQLSYLNLMVHHDLKADKYNQPKVDIDSIYDTVSLLKQLKTVKLSANPPWDARPITGITPLLTELTLLESMSFFLWLKTAARVLFSLKFPSKSLPHLKDLTISIYFRLEGDFFKEVGEFLGNLSNLEKLNLSIAYYNKLSVAEFKDLLEQLGKLKKLKQVQIMLNVTNSKRESQIERLMETMRRGHNNQRLEILIEQVNDELGKEKNDIERELGKLFDEVKSIKKLLFLHNAKQHFSVAYSR